MAWWTPDSATWSACPDERLRAEDVSSWNADEHHRDHEHRADEADHDRGHESDALVRRGGGRVDSCRSVRAEVRLRRLISESSTSVVVG